nr:pyruvate kinase alpha/beta domain-containing protein [uncultured Methanobrevibacter sp.]
MERKFITYFEQEGNDYTDDLIRAVKDKLDKSPDIKRILIASSTGESALKLYGAIDDKNIEIVNVTHHMGFKEENVADISDEMIDKLEDVGIKTFIGSHAFSGAARGVTNKYGGYSPLDIVADTLRMFSHGVKVSAEISIMAADAGLIPVGEKIIAIGGRGHGVDTAVILTPVNAKDLFNLKFHEIIAMPKD